MLDKATKNHLRKLRKEIAELRSERKYLLRQITKRMIEIREIKAIVTTDDILSNAKEAQC